MPEAKRVYVYWNRGRVVYQCVDNGVVKSQIMVNPQRADRFMKDIKYLGYEVVAERNPEGEEKPFPKRVRGSLSFLVGIKE